MRTRDVGAPSGVGPLPHKYRRSPLQRRTFLTLVGSYPLLVTPGEAWYIPYISTGETRTANRERLPRVHASTVPADQRRAAPTPCRDAPQGSSRWRARPPPPSGPCGDAASAAASACAGAHWSGACAGLSRGASTKRRRRRSRRARPNIWRFSIFRRLMCPSTGLVLHGRVTPALTAS